MKRQYPTSQKAREPHSHWKHLRKPGKRMANKSTRRQPIDVA